MTGVPALPTPVFVTFRDRQTMLRRCIESLWLHGFRDITIIDNDSFMPLDIDPADGPSQVKIVRADNTHRQMAPWALGLVPPDRPYVVTDCDCELTEDCPPDVEQVMLDVLARHPEIAKVGLGIDTRLFPDPPPPHYAYSYEQERRVIGYPLIEPGLRAIPIDTTFAAYQPGGDWPGICGARLEAPYLINHLPWLNAQYSEEERLYYSRSDMATWARTHSAACLVSAKIVVGFTALRAETVVSLHGQDVQFAPLLTDTAYFDLLADRWTPKPGQIPEPFIVIEHDICDGERPLCDAIKELKDCPHDWCAYPYPYLNAPAATGLGFCKFSDRIIVRNPWVWTQIAGEGTADHPPRHWCRVDFHLYNALAARGEVRHEHYDSLPVGHMNTTVTHGCISENELRAIGRA